MNIQNSNLYTLPLYNDKSSRWTAEYDLSKERFTFYFSWNTRCSYWELSIYDKNGQFLIGGVKLVKYIDLLELYRDVVPGLPKGELSIIPIDNSVVDITVDNLNEKFALTYTEE